MEKPEPLYTLRELEDITFRPISFWDEECRTKRITFIQPAGPKGTRLIPASAYSDWCTGSQRAAKRANNSAVLTVPAEAPKERYLSKGAQEAFTISI